MRFDRAPATKAFAEGIRSTQVKLLERAKGLERRLADREVLRTEYRLERDTLEEIAVRLDLASAIIGINEGIEKSLGASQAPASLKRRELLEQVVIGKNQQIEKLLALRKKIASHKEDPELLGALKEIHAEMLEAEHLAGRTLKGDAKDRLEQAHIINTLEERLRRHDTIEAMKEAAIRVADELVIDVPERHLKHGHEPLRRESRSRMAKR